MTAPPPRFEVLVTPGTQPERVARALATCTQGAPSLVALIVPIGSAGTTAVRLLDESGGAAVVSLETCAAALSAGGRRAGLARIDAAAGTRSWETWEDGVRTQQLTPADELWLPHDSDGMPDLDAEPRTGAPADTTGWRRLRTCLDLGMQALSSCRFTPVTRAFERLAAHEASAARAFVLVSEGRVLHPPAEVGLRDLLS